jgi:hypothetical protein
LASGTIGKRRPSRPAPHGQTGKIPSLEACGTRDRAAQHPARLGGCRTGRPRAAPGRRSPLALAPERHSPLALPPEQHFEPRLRGFPRRSRAQAGRLRPVPRSPLHLQGARFNGLPLLDLDTLQPLVGCSRNVNPEPPKTAPSVTALSPPQNQQHTPKNTPKSLTRPAKLSAVQGGAALNATKTQPKPCQTLPNHTKNRPFPATPVTTF